jgi:hypothetical protein
MKVALACDHLLARDYSVEILDRLCEIFPRTEIYTFAFIQGSVSGDIEHRKIHASYLSHKVKSLADLEKHKYLLPNIAETLCMDGDFDVLISVSSGFAHGFKVPQGKKHISYIWNKNQAYGKPGLLSKIFRSYLNNWQIRKIRELDNVFFSSKTLFFEGMKNIVYPPVNLEKFPQAYSHTADQVLINVSSIEDELVKRLTTICEKSELKYLLLDTTFRKKDWSKIGIDKSLVVNSKCPSTLRELFDKCFVFLDLSTREFNPEMITSLALGRPLILRDEQLYKEYFSTETAIFLSDEQIGELGERLCELHLHQDAFFPSILQRNTFAFHPTRFKHTFRKEVEQLCQVDS